MVNLTPGAIESIMEGKVLENPVLQVNGKKVIPKTDANKTDRFRLLLSDGKHSISTAMLATQLNHMVTSGEIEKFAVIKLKKYTCNPIQPDKRVMILLDVEVVALPADVNETIGNPTNYKPGAANGGASNGSHAAPSGGEKKNFYGSAAPQSNAMSRVQSTNPSANLPQTPGGSVPKIFPIESLTPYQNRWTIRAKVTQKSGIRTWNNSRGEGKLFSMNLLDESGEIRCTGFKQEVDKFYEMIEVNKVYYITKGTLAPANKQYTSLTNEYEMKLNRDSQITLCEDDVDLPSIKFDFVPINSLGEKQPNSIIDVIGVVRSAADVSSIMTKKDNREVKKRDLELVDTSGQMIRLTLWGQEAETFQGSSHPVMAIKGARLSDFGGRSMSTLGSSQIMLNPDIPESHTLRGWYDSEGHTMDFNTFYNEGGAGGGGGSLSNWKMLVDVLDENLGHKEKADYFTTKGTIAFLRKENCMYMACPSQECNKKLVDNGNSTYRCEKCSKEFDSYKWRMILSINLVDSTGSQWVTCFQESAESVLGCPAADVGEMRSSDEAAFDRLFTEATFKQFIFRLRAKTETYNDEERLKVVCVSATPINLIEYNARLIQDIETLSQA